MTDEHNLVTVGRFDGEAYKSSQAAEQTLNAAILRAEIARSYEEEIFETFYADDVVCDLHGFAREFIAKLATWR